MPCHTLLLVCALLCLFRNYFLFIRYTKQPVLSFAFAVRCAQTTLFQEFLKTKEVFLNSMTLSSYIMKLASKNLSQ